MIILIIKDSPWRRPCTSRAMTIAPPVANLKKRGLARRSPSAVLNAAYRSLGRNLSRGKLDRILLTCLVPTTPLQTQGTESQSVSPTQGWTSGETWELISKCRRQIKAICLQRLWEFVCEEVWS